MCGGFSVDRDRLRDFSVSRNRFDMSGLQRWFLSCVEELQEDSGEILLRYGRMI